MKPWAESGNDRCMTPHADESGRPAVSVRYLLPRAQTKFDSDAELPGIGVGVMLAVAAVWLLLLAACIPLVFAIVIGAVLAAVPGSGRGVASGGDSSSDAEFR